MHSQLGDAPMDANRSSATNATDKRAADTYFMRSLSRFSSMERCSTISYSQKVVERHAEILMGYIGFHSFPLFRYRIACSGREPR